LSILFMRKPLSLSLCLKFRFLKRCGHLQGLDPNSYRRGIAKKVPVAGEDGEKIMSLADGPLMPGGYRLCGGCSADGDGYDFWSSGNSVGHVRAQDDLKVILLESRPDAVAQLGDQRVIGNKLTGGGGAAHTNSGGGDLILPRLLVTETGHDGIVPGDGGVLLF
jgi:hypothetical protein